MTETNTPLQIHVPQAITVKVDSGEEAPSLPDWFKKLMEISSLILFLVVLGTYTFFARRQTESFPVGFNGNPYAWVVIDSPPVASLRDPFDVQVTFVNRSQQTLNGTLTLIADGDHLLTLEAGTSGAVKVEDLPPGASFSHTFNLIALERPDGGEYVFQAGFEDENGISFQASQSNIIPVKVWPWPPHLRFILKSLLTTSGALAPAAVLWWDRVKKFLTAQTS
jgi:hypothetical protein